MKLPNKTYFAVAYFVFGWYQLSFGELFYHGANGRYLMFFILAIVPTFLMLVPTPKAIRGGKALLIAGSFLLVTTMALCAYSIHVENTIAAQEQLPTPPNETTGGLVTRLAKANADAETLNAIALFVIAIIACLTIITIAMRASPTDATKGIMSTVAWSIAVFGLQLAWTVITTFIIYFWFY